MKTIRIIIALFVLAAPALRSQEQTTVFGYFQPYFTSFSNEYGAPGPPTGEQNYSYNMMGVGQFNLFMQRLIAEDMTAFVNFEYINNYSSSQGFGAYGIQEAYLLWDYRDYLRVKLGIVIPKFNAMFQIYNRTPLLPYLNRPKLYEASNGNLVDIFNILPQKALIHVDGFIPTSFANFDYAVYLSGPSNGFISSKENDLLPGYVAFGQSSVTYIGFGGRIGVTAGPVKAGVSVSSDVENKRKYLAQVAAKYRSYMDDSVALAYLNDPTELGDIDRVRVGVDVTVTLGDLTVAGEYLQTRSDVPAAAQALLDQWHAADPYYIGGGFDKKFYYVSATYYLAPEMYLFAMYDYLDDKADPFYFGIDGYYGVNTGAGYHINESVVLKAQYTRNQARYDIQELGPDDQRDFFDYWYSVGTSISF